jgi:hypothetical protein
MIAKTFSAKRRYLFTLKKMFSHTRTIGGAGGARAVDATDVLVFMQAMVARRPKVGNARRVGGLSAKAT